MLTLIIFILVLSVLVCVHELGHFLTARRFGVRAEEFGFGFAPRAIGLYRNSLGKWRWVKGNKPVEDLEASADSSLKPAPRATIYSLNWLPLGGFVKIKGENGDGEGDSDSFISKSIGKRIIILAAGVIMNIILAWFLFSIGYMIGLPQSTDTLSKHARVTQPQVMIAEVLPASPAEMAGLKAGDAVLSVNGQPVSNEQSLQDAVAPQSGKATVLNLKREGKIMDITVTPQAKEGGRATMGVAIYAAGLVHYPFLSAIWEGAKTTVWLTGRIFVAFYGLFADIFQGHNVGDQFAGPVGIATVTGQAARLGFSYLLQFMALLSLNLAVLNILPFPALDGGRILFLLIEKIKGKPVKREVEAMIHNVGFILLIVLIVFVTYKDIIKLF